MIGDMTRDEFRLSVSLLKQNNTTKGTFLKSPDVSVLQGLEQGFIESVMEALFTEEVLGKIGQDFEVLKGPLRDLGIVV